MRNDENVINQAHFHENSTFTFVYGTFLLKKKCFTENSYQIYDDKISYYWKTI